MKHLFYVSCVCKYERDLHTHTLQSIIRLITHRTNSYKNAILCRTLINLSTLDLKNTFLSNFHLMLQYIQWLQRWYTKVSRIFIEWKKYTKKMPVHNITKKILKHSCANWVGISIPKYLTYSNLRKFPSGIGVPQQQGNGKSTRKNYNVACTWMEGVDIWRYIQYCVTHMLLKKVVLLTYPVYLYYYVHVFDVINWITEPEN